MATLPNVRKRAFGRLTGASGNPTAAEDSLLTDVYGEVYAALAADGLVSWGPADDVPAQFVQPVVALMASAVAMDFGNPELVLGEAGEEAERREIARLLAPEAEQTTIQTEYF